MVQKWLCSQQMMILELFVLHFVNYLTHMLSNRSTQKKFIEGLMLSGIKIPETAAELSHEAGGSE